MDMSRFLAIKTKTSVKFFEMGSSVRPLTVVNNRLYRTDEFLMCANKTGGDEFVLYDLDGTQPYGLKEYLNPDETMALIDVARSNNKKAVSRLSWLTNLNMAKLTPFIVIAVLAYAFLNGGFRWRIIRTGRFSRNP